MRPEKVMVRLILDSGSENETIMRMKGTWIGVVCFLLGILCAAISSSLLDELHWRKEKSLLRDFAVKLASAGSVEGTMMFKDQAEVLGDRELESYFSCLFYNPMFGDKAISWEKSGRKFIAWGYGKDPRTGERAFVASNLNLVFSLDEDIDWDTQTFREETEP